MHPIARLTTVTLAALLACAIATYFYPLGTPPIDLKLGKKDFDRLCARCHSVDTPAIKYGPSLLGFPKSAGNRVKGETAAVYAWKSIVEPDAYRSGEGLMPSNLAAELGESRVRNIVAFLLQSDINASIKEILRVSRELPVAKTEHKIQQFDIQTLEKGRELFLGEMKCVSCHTLNPGHTAAHLAAPSLESVGHNKLAFLEDSLRQPSKSIAPGFERSMLNDDGNLIIGRLVFEDDRTLRLLVTDNGKWKVIDENKDGLASNGVEFSKSAVSLMPAYSDNDISSEQIDALLAFLQILR